MPDIYVTIEERTLNSNVNKRKIISVKQITSGNLLYGSESSNLMLSDNLEAWDGMGGRRKMGGRFKKEGTYVYLWLIHVDI